MTLILNSFLFGDNISVFLDLDNYHNAIATKSKNPYLKVILSIGGWNEGSEKYSEMASSSVTRKIFIDSVVGWLQKYGFDGLDMDWEYPGQRGGKVTDKDNFSKLLKVGLSYLQL